MNGMAFCVNTNCCAVQRNETYRIAKYLKINGLTEIQSIYDADINLITTCGVTEDAEDESLSIIDKVYAQKNADSKVIISGCLPNISVDILKSRYGDAIIIPFDRLNTFDEIINANISINSVYYNAEPDYHHSNGDPRVADDKYLIDEKIAYALDEKYCTDKFTEAFKYNTQGRYLWKDNSIFEIKISSGCKNECSYCASRFGIGKYRSKEKNKIIEELKIGLDKGYKKFMLMGDELGAYGEDINTSLTELLRDMIAVNSDIKIGIRYIYPDFLIEMYPRLKKFMNNVFFICISIQSASASVLKAMNREDTIQPLFSIIKEIKENYEEVFLHTQVIVGFPNECEEDFDATVQFLEECCFDYVRYNVFSRRPKTEAENMQNIYDEAELNARLKKMKHLCEKNRNANLYRRYRDIVKRMEMGE